VKLKIIKDAKLSNPDGEFDGVFVAKDDEALNSGTGVFLTGKLYNIAYPCGDISSVDAAALQIAYQLDLELK